MKKKTFKFVINTFYFFRRAEWEKSIEKVNKHNQGYLNGEHTWTMGINQFSDGTSPAFGDFTPENVGLPVIEVVEVYEANDEEWEKYKLKHEKKYTKEEELLKYKTILEKS